MDTYDPLQTIFREVKPKDIVAKKQDIIRDHLHSAFWLVADQRSPASVHVLAMAAHEMLTSIAHRNRMKIPYEIKGLRVQESKKDRVEAKFLYNFFKHARNDEEADARFSMRNLAILNELTLAASCVNFRKIYQSTDAAIERFLAFHALRFRAMLQEEGLELISSIEKEKPISEEERLVLLRSGLVRAFAKGPVPDPFGG